MKSHALIILLIASVSTGTSWTQTDWSGGPGTPGPVEEWGGAFSSQTNLDWSVPGQLMIDVLTVGEAFLPGTPAVSGFGQATAVCVSDFSGDGLPDIAGGFWETGRVEVAINLGSGAWQTVDVDESVEGPVMLAASDFDGDGDADLALSEMNGDGIVWYTNSGSGTAWAGHPVGSCPGAYACVAWDPDLDGDSDILCTSRDGGWAGWFENQSGTGSSWVVHKIDDQIAQPVTAVTGDFNGDQWPDLAVAGEGDVRLAVYMSPGYPRTTIATDSIGAIFSGLEAADFTGDGLDDLAGGSSMSGMIVCFQNPGSTPAWPRVTATTEDSNSLFAMDLDSDGDQDIVSSSVLNDYLWLARNQGNGSMWSSIPEAYVGLDGFFAMDTGDFDADGETDLAGSSYYGEALLTMLWGERDIYANFAVIYSSILHVEEASGQPWYMRFEGEGQISIVFYYSDDPGALEHSDPVTLMPGYWYSLAGLMEPGADYFRYKINMPRILPSVTPVLTEITFSDDLTGIGGPVLPPPPRVAPVANPAHGSIIVGVEMPDAGTIELAVFDMAGRLVETLHSGALVAGEYSFGSGPLPAGCYSVVYRTGAGDGSFRVAVLR